MAVRQKTYRVIDLFSGAGGMTLGFSPEFGHPFVPVWANDFDANSVLTYDGHFGSRYGGHCIQGDIVELLRDQSLIIPQADIVIGGPPCQGFSLLNRNREGDPRKQLWRPFLEVVKRANADVFVMENVPQLLGSPEHDQVIRAAKRLGFMVTSAKLCAADYGVPQIRWRAFIVGCKFTDPSLTFPPRPTHYDPNANGKSRSLSATSNTRDVMVPRKTVRDAIFDLPPPEGKDVRFVPPPLNLHFGRSPTQESISRYKAIPKEGMNRFDLQRRAPHLTPACWIRKKSGGTDLFGRLWWNRPAFTIRTEFFKPEKGRYLHPSQHRPITHREAARLQSFPDHFLFCGSKIEIAKQIGNAVPPVLAAAVAESILGLFQYKEQKTRRTFSPKRSAAELCR